MNEKIMNILMNMTREFNELDEMKGNSMKRPDRKTSSKLFQDYTAEEVVAMYHASKETIED